MVRYGESVYQSNTDNTKLPGTKLKRKLIHRAIVSYMHGNANNDAFKQHRYKVREELKHLKRFCWFHFLETSVRQNWLV